MRVLFELTDAPVADLRPAPHNPRTITTAQFDALKRSLQADPDMLRARPVIALPSGEIVAGAMRCRAAEALGWPTIPTVYVDLDDRRAREWMVRDNNQYGDWQEDELAELLYGLQEKGAALDLLGFDRAEIDRLLANVSGPETLLGDPDEVPDPPADPVTKPGDLWLLGDHRVLCGDSTVLTDVERLMDGQKAEMVWTDPPYGVAIGDKNKYLNSVGRSNRIEENLVNDTLDETALLQMLRDAFSNSMAAGLAGAAWYVAAPAGPLHVLFGQALKELGIWRQTIQWVKNNATFAPLGVDYHWRAEPIFYGWLPNAAHRYYGGRQQNTVWEIDRPAKSPDHPTTKPVELVARAVTNSSLRGEVVLDPFLGSGTTLVAAEQLGRCCYGMEISPAYCDVIVARWERLTGKKAVLEQREATAV